MASYTHDADTEHKRPNNPNVPSDPGSECLPSAVKVDNGGGAIKRYEDLLESASVATFFSVMASTKASPAERLTAASAALDAIGKRTPVQMTPTPGITLNLINPIQNAFRGIADVVDVLDRTPRLTQAHAHEVEEDAV